MAPRLASVGSITSTTNRGNSGSANGEGSLAGPDECNGSGLGFAFLLALALRPAMAEFSVRFGDGVVITGDSPGTIVRKAGRQPDRSVQLENRHGAAVGERWEYYLDNKQVNFEIREGRVVDIQEVRSRIIAAIPAKAGMRAVPAATVLSAGRSEERRVGKECVSTCISRWSPDHSKKHNTNTTQYTTN